MNWLRLLFLLFGGLICAASAAAGFPAPYAPTVVQPTGAPQRFEFDLSAALR
jgi:predicted phosphoribosyltransferase